MYAVCQACIHLWLLQLLLLPEVSETPRNNTYKQNKKQITQKHKTRWLYCVECPSG